MLSQLLGEMESEGIDELDYPRFESVVCRTLGDIALARSRAQQVTDEVRTQSTFSARPEGYACL